MVAGGFRLMGQPMPQIWPVISLAIKKLGVHFFFARALSLGPF
jgi:hypothetical protein